MKNRASIRFHAANISLDTIRCIGWWQGTRWRDIASLAGIISAIGAAWWLLWWLGASVTLKLMGVTLAVAVLAAKHIPSDSRRGTLSAIGVAAAFGVLYMLPPGVYLWRYWIVIRVCYSSVRLIADLLLGIAVCVIGGCIICLFASGGEALVRTAIAFVQGLHSKHQISNEKYCTELRRALVFVCLVSGIMFVGRPVETALCSAMAKHYFCRFIVDHGPPPSPLERWLLILQYGYDSELVDYAYAPQGFWRIYESCRDRLTRSGALVHRTFVFRHVKINGKAGAIWRDAMRLFPDNIHTTSSNWVKGHPFVLEVWARPDELPKWEKFVQEYDIPEASENANIAPRE